MATFVYIENQINVLRYENQKAVKESVHALFSAIKSLNPSVGTLIQNDGTESRLLLLTGTIPITFQGAQYNIPIDIFLPLAFPNKAPIVYVRPTAEMIVPSSHTNVDTGGLVHVSYLDDWRTSSSLLELIRNLKIIFSNKPPLFSKSSKVVTTPSPKTSGVFVSSNNHSEYPVYNSAQYNHNNNNSNSSSNSNNINHNNGDIMSRPGLSEGNNGNFYGKRSSTMESSMNSTTSLSSTNNTSPPNMKPTLSKRQQLMEEVTSKLQQELHQQYSKIAEQIDLEFVREAKLMESTSKSTIQLKELQQLKLKMDQSINDIEEKKLKLIANKSNWESQTIVSHEDLTIPYDDLSLQITTIVADNLTIEDALYYLNKSLTSDSRKSDLTSFLKETRKLARQQFITRVHIEKIRNSMKQTFASLT